MSVQETLERGEALNPFQLVAQATHDIVSPGNVIDAAAFRGAIYSAPRFDSWKGILIGIPSYGADVVDGPAARATGTDSELGAKVDAGGDKIKVLWALINIWKSKQAPKSLLAVVAAQNLANMAITGLDRLEHDEPRVNEVTPIGKKAMFFQTGGVGINVIGNKVAEDRPVLSKALKVAGTAIGFYGFARYGMASTRDYWKTYRGTKQPAPPANAGELLESRRLQAADR